MVDILPNTHSFNIHLAMEYGVKESIVLSTIIYWCENNKANDKHFYDDKYWCYNSHEAWSSLMPYFSSTQVKRIISKLLKDGVLLKGNYNKVGYDKTCWYSYDADKLLKLNIVRNRPIDKTKSSHRIDETVPPIPVHTSSNTVQEKKEKGVLTVKDLKPRDNDDRVPVTFWGVTWEEFQEGCPKEFIDTAKVMFPDQSFNWFDAKEALKLFYNQNATSRSMFPKWKWRDILIKNLNSQKRK